MPGTPLPSSWNNSSNGTANLSDLPVRREGAIQVGDANVYVHQGPEAIAQLAFNPPTWIGLAMKLVILVVLGLAALSVYRHGVDEELVEEMSFMALVAVGVIVATRAFVIYLEVAYVLDVLGGAVTGWVAALLFKQLVYRIVDGAPSGSDYPDY